MPFNIENVTSEVTVIDGDLPLTHAQTESLVRLIMKRIDDRNRAASLAHDDSAIRRQISPALLRG